MKLTHLEQLLVFSQEKTLSRTAERLLISQSTLSRNMQELEAALGVQLFHRQKNKLSLTETGEYAILEAQKLLASYHQFPKAIQQFSRDHQQIRGCSSSPGLTWLLENRSPRLQVQIASDEDCFEGLLQGNVDFALTSQPSQSDQLQSRLFFTEKLYLSLPAQHLLAQRESVRLADLSGLSMIIRREIGAWSSLVNSLDQTQFIVQDDEQFEDLINHFDLPSFSTNISQTFGAIHQERINLPIQNPESSMDFYISYPKDKEDQLRFLWDMLDVRTD